MDKKKNALIVIGTVVIVIIVMFGVYKLFFQKLSNAEVAQVLKSRIVPLSTVEPGSDFKDLEPLKEVLKDKQIVAMGGSTYGTSEFFKVKHRMFQFLVEEMGYRVFAIDGEYGQAKTINDYIVNGTGTAEEVIKVMKIAVLFSWSAEESLALVNWMREYNENPSNKEKIKFYGIYSSQVSQNTRDVLKYLQVNDEEMYKAFDIKLKALKNDNLYMMDPSELKEHKSKAEELISIVKEKRDIFISRTSEEEYDEILHQAQVIIQCVDFAIYNSVEHSREDGINTLGKYMAENVKWILEHEGKQGNNKVMIWANNSYVSKDSTKYKTVGAQLSEMFKDKYYSIGIEFHQGEFAALPAENGSIVSKIYKNYSIPEGNPKLFSNVFKVTENQISFLDLNSASQDKKINKILSASRIMHNIAGYNGYEEEYYSIEVPIKGYDGLIFINDTTAIKVIR
ncbi:MAG: erythromycin esterase family protein [Clostridium sp.]|uniref:erythromycin esterase family protein n=1 Tax=Clostridium sp. TaxID=1506 RepID=UPI00303FC967